MRTDLNYSRRFGFAVAAILACGLLLSACAHEGAYEAKRSTRYQVPFNNVALTTAQLQESIAVEESGGERTAANGLGVWATLRNRTDRPYHVTVRTHFFDGQRAPMEVTAWQRLFVDGRTLATYRTSSTTEGVAFYYIEVAEGS